MPVAVAAAVAVAVVVVVAVAVAVAVAVVMAVAVAVVALFWERFFLRNRVGWGINKLYLAQEGSSKMECSQNHFRLHFC